MSIAEQNQQQPAKTALITGAAKRIGACISKTLHQAGWNIIIHYHHSEQTANELAEKLNQQRPNSAATVQCDLSLHQNLNQLFESYQTAIQQKKWQPLSLLVNNASRFFPTPLSDTTVDTNTGSSTSEQWQALFNSNAQAPLLLCQLFQQDLKQQQGSIVNIIDIYADKMLLGYSIYRASKAALLSLNNSLAVELAPSIRVNAISPGIILWPEDSSNIDNENFHDQQHILSSIPLQKIGEPADIANAVLFLSQANYITGQNIAVDGGLSLV